MIDVRRWNLPFRIGATSYIVPADLLPNAQFLAAHVQDMQLVLFEVSGGPSNLPSPADVAALAQVGRTHDLSYTVHLLEDLRLHDEDGAPAHALAKAQQVIELTRPLHPRAWVCHLDGRPVRHLPAPSPASLLSASASPSPASPEPLPAPSPPPSSPPSPAPSPAPVPAPASAPSPAYARWLEDTAVALERVCTWAGRGARVAVENLEGYPPDFVTPVVARTSAGRCLDVGHLWLDDLDPLPHLAAALPRLQVVHLHGVRPAKPPGATTSETTGETADTTAGETSGETVTGAVQDSRDHNSLAHADPDQLDRVLAALLRARFSGVLCLEIFGEDDFWSSLAALEAAVDRVRRQGETAP